LEKEILSFFFQSEKPKAGLHSGSPIDNVSLLIEGRKQVPALRLKGKPFDGEVLEASVIPPPASRGRNPEVPKNLTIY